MALNQPSGRHTAARPAAAHAGKALVGSGRSGSHPDDIEAFLVQFDPLEQRRQIREGIEAVIIERVAKDLLHVPVQTLLANLNLPSSTILRKMAREERLSPAESDRVARVLYVRQLAVEVFEDPALAAEWMQRSNAELGGLSPLEVLDSQPGYDRVREILLRVIHGVSA
ncbi:antitoxin Xre/MbcA/ParS toxin-binding domain-containing protein [Paraburkholderia guartelaensis]|uniref:antitoxin Xre/MbcA/ParS toxin-binding domain-containing protein n=1 Tax=Paraburkholderia guartelaensis TaxID=2546446 RepID=UPI002AB79BFE|nr:antitoxin Xre/MbcA/ParS toxin-binding domain-containing protein [Paraburkholderia guartelaensis]